VIVAISFGNFSLKMRLPLSSIIAK
jgi:hypothetical protein